jgi:uncharacterized protein YgfB (UPF0149 family)
MPPVPLPDFEHALGLAGGSMDAAELSECHGAACGLLCRQAGADGEDFLRLLALLQLVAGPGVELRGTMLDLHRATGSQLDDEQMRLALWLPGDEEPLEERTRALAQWCTGFLAGLGSGGKGLGELSAEALEALEDMREIARAELGGGVSAEEEEQAFAQIVEYVRVVAMLLREEMRGPEPDDRIH